MQHNGLLIVAATAMLMTAVLLLVCVVTQIELMEAVKMGCLN